MSDPKRAIRINEEIKHIVDAFRPINIVALNTLLTARKAGVRSLVIGRDSNTNLRPAVGIT